MWKSYIDFNTKIITPHIIHAYSLLLMETCTLVSLLLDLGLYAYNWYYLIKNLNSSKKISVQYYYKTHILSPI